MSARQRPFFVGYGNKIPKDIASLLFPVFALFIAAFIALSLLLSGTQEDAGDGGFRWDLGAQNLTGIVEFHPYPVLRLPPDEDNPARTLMLAGNGKRGALDDPQVFANQAMSARGLLLQRGEITMMQVNERQSMKVAPDALPASFTPAPPRDLGRWRLSGEICDGKCYVGAMRPGRGLAHKACANLCISGGTPAVFVSSSAVAGNQFFLLADHEGNPLGEEMFDLVALYIEAEGRVEQLDDLAIFKMDLSTVRVLP
ncbi:MAG: hypothetical protein AAFN43_05240 [Pseudomonadota bacterium]